MLVDELKRYAKRIGIEAEISSDSKPVKGLPLFVEAANDWYEAVIGEYPITLAVAKRTGLSPQDVITQWKSMRKNNDHDFVMVLRSEEDQFCAVLDAAHVDYIMPGSRLHVEGKMMLVTRKAARGGYKPKGRMTVVAQQIVLSYLLHGCDGRSAFEELMSSLKLGQVRVSVAARELERLNLCSIDRAWRAHAIVWPENKRELWNRALPLMDSPVQRTMRIRKPPKVLPVAGIEALAVNSMLAYENDPTFAISRHDPRLKSINDERYIGATLEVWKYDPLPLAPDGIVVDPLSLYLSLRDNPDPRVQGELKTMLEELQW